VLAKKQLDYIDFVPVLGISLFVDQMTRCRLVYLLLLTALIMGAEAAKGGVRGRGRGRGRLYGSRIPILIPNRNPASTHYYENKDVSCLCIMCVHSVIEI
jgi:hypothetical protein